MGTQRSPGPDQVIRGNPPTLRMRTGPSPIRPVNRIRTRMASGTTAGNWIVEWPGDSATSTGVPSLTDTRADVAIAPSVFWSIVSRPKRCFGKSRRKDSPATGSAGIQPVARSPPSVEPSNTIEPRSTGLPKARELARACTADDEPSRRSISRSIAPLARRTVPVRSYGRVSGT